jgi:hypothetical protein
MPFRIEVVSSNGAKVKTTYKIPEIARFVRRRRKADPSKANLPMLPWLFEMALDELEDIGGEAEKILIERCDGKNE